MMTPITSGMSALEPAAATVRLRRYTCGCYALLCYTMLYRIILLYY